MHFLRLVFIAVIGYYFIQHFHHLIDMKMAEVEPAHKPFITMVQREKELECLAKNIYYEAGTEPFEGKVAVAQVTINRTKSKDFPKDICSVVYERNIVYNKVLCQFSWYCDRDSSFKPINKKAYEESMTVAKKVLLENFRLPSLTTAMYYHADYINPGWKKERITQVGHHIFYR